MGERINSTHMDYTRRMNSTHDTALAAIILATIGTSLTLVIIIYWMCCQVRRRRTSARRKDVPLDIKRSVIEHDHLINNLTVKLRDAVRDLDRKLVDMGSPVDVADLRLKSDAMERLLNEKLSQNDLSIQPDVMVDITSLRSRVHTLETTAENIAQELRRISGGSDSSLKAKTSPTESPAAKGLQSYQNNRMFEEIMAYRGKIVSIEKREAETRKQLRNLQQKVASVMAELNMADDNPVHDTLSDTALDSNNSLPASGASSQFDTNPKSKHTSWAKTIQAEPSPSVKSSMPSRPPVPIIKKLDYPAHPVAVDVTMDTEMNTYLNARLTDLTGTGNLSGRGSEEDFFPKASPSDGLQIDLSRAFDVGSDSNLNRTICKSRDFEMGSDTDYGLDILKGSDVDKGVKLYKNFNADVGSDSQAGRVIVSRNNSYDSNVDTYDRFGSGVDSSENNTRIWTSSAPARPRGIGVGGALTVVGTAFSINDASVVEESDPLLDSEC